jgi:hypothetical protein
MSSQPPPPPLPILFAREAERLRAEIDRLRFRIGQMEAERQADLGIITDLKRRIDILWELPR